ncbi:MAG: transporter substrate-binding domain-containing protein [Parvibaculaceae bacterium]|nr:transporter substrate-binding domain-containing protein [Parvibaculaceae bacterium]
MNILLKINIAFLALLLLALGVMLEESPLHGAWKSGITQVAEWFEPKSTDATDDLNSAEPGYKDPKASLALVPHKAAILPVDEEIQNVELTTSDPFANLAEAPGAPMPLINPHRVAGEPLGIEQPILSEKQLVEAEKMEAANSTSPVKTVPLRIATEGNFPPFNFTNGDGQLAGFEVDLVNALCAQMKRDCELIPQEWKSLLPGLAEGRWDLVMASLRIPGKANEGIIYTKPYYRLPAQLVVRKGDVSNRRAPILSGKEVLVQSGSRHEAYVMQHFPNALRRTVPTFEEAWDRFVLGEAMFFFGDRVAILQQMAATQCCMLAGKPIVDPSFFSEGVGFALPDTGPSAQVAEAGGQSSASQPLTLKTQLENGLSALIANGTYEDISTRYFNENIF